MNYRDFNDFELVGFVREQSEEANEILFEKYRPFIEVYARKMYKTCDKNGLEFNDLVQEGMVGLNQAINTFDDSKDASFYTYAKTLIERKIITAVVTSDRLKHKLLNDSISYDKDELELQTKMFADNTKNPESLILEKSELNNLINNIKTLLTPFEITVFNLKISGFSYIEIGEKLGKDKKQIDNAIQRIKNKIKDNLDN